MTLKRIFFGTCFALSLSTLAHAEANAGPSGMEAAEQSSVGPATEFVQARAAQVLAGMNDDSATVEARRESLRSVVGALIDFRLLAERTLGEHWEPRSDEERELFVGLLREMVEASYTSRVRAGRVETGEYELDYTGESERRGRHRVDAILRADGGTHYLEVKLQSSEESGFVVYDVVTDDISLEESYSESFHNIITEHGWDDLIRRMQERIAELRS